MNDMHARGAESDHATRSLWMATAAAPAFTPLPADAQAQVCIVGAGIAGLTTAYRLACSGIEVLVLDQHGLDGGQTARSTGHLCDALDDRYFALEQLHGAEGARLAAQSHAAAVDEIERICREEAIACDFARVDGYLVHGQGDRRGDVLEREFAAARRAGLAVERLPGAPGMLAMFGDTLRFPNQARFHPLRYLAGLAQAVQRRGGRIHTGTRVAAVHGGDRPSATTATGKRVRADAMVVATHVPFNDRLVIHTKQAAYRSYVLALRIAEDAVPDALLWDTLDPYHYVRTAHAGGETWLVVGGEDRKTGQDASPQYRFAALERWTRARFPMAGAVGHRWSGQIIEPMDALAFIGRNPGLEGNLYIATGDSGDGLTHGTIAGLLLADLVALRESPWTRLYAPNRKNLHAVDTFLRENLNFVPYYGELVSGGVTEAADELAPGTAAVLRHGLHKVAAWRDEVGELHLHSAICPHLGCVVHWNPVERSWDCPCHGSRFAADDGRRLNGPADRGLSPIDAEDLHPARTPHAPGTRPSARL